MILTAVLWLLVWSGMYSDVSQFNPDRLLAGPTAFLLALRPFFPIIASVFCFLVLVRAGRFSVHLKRGPLFYLSIYGLIGGAFFFLSPKPFESIYWSLLFLSVLFVAWTLINEGDPEARIRYLMDINLIVILLNVLLNIIGPLWPIIMGAENPRVYRLPFGLGVQTANGVGRFAGLAALIAFARLFGSKLLPGIFWSSILAGSVAAIAFSESRTAILGFILGVVIVVVLNRKYVWLAVFAPGLAYLFYLSLFSWRFKGSLQVVFMISGREATWKKALSIALKSPIVGHGFHADRFLLEGEHVHMAYLHSLVQGGIFGAALFLMAIVGIWWLVFRLRLFRQALPPTVRQTESIAILGFLTARSFFESTAAFYGVDLLIFVPIIISLQYWKQSADALEDAAREDANAPESETGLLEPSAGS